jgi:hypothetical protein
VQASDGSYRSASEGSSTYTAPDFPLPGPVARAGPRQRQNCEEIACTGAGHGPRATSVAFGRIHPSTHHRPRTASSSPILLLFSCTARSPTPGPCRRRPAGAPSRTVKPLCPPPPAPPVLAMSRCSGKRCFATVLARDSRPSSLRWPCPRLRRTSVLFTTFAAHKRAPFQVGTYPEW